jgi:hypothetical protein
MRTAGTGKPWSPCSKHSDGRPRSVLVRCGGASFVLGTSWTLGYSALNTAARSTAPQRLSSGADAPDIISVLVHTEAGVVGGLPRAARPGHRGRRPGNLIDAVGPAVEYYVKDTPDLQGRVLDVQIVDVEPE